MLNRFLSLLASFSMIAPPEPGQASQVPTGTIVLIVAAVVITVAAAVALVVVIVRKKGRHEKQ